MRQGAGSLEHEIKCLRAARRLATKRPARIVTTFLGARGKAQDRAAQSNVRNALPAEKTYFTDNQAYPTTGITFTQGGLNLGIGGETVRMSPNNVPQIFVNTTASTFCVLVSNTNSSRAVGYRWQSDLGGLQASDATCTGYGNNVVPAATP